MEPDSMTAKEALRLIDWLKAHGYTTDKAIECVEYVTGTEKPQQSAEETPGE